MKQSFVLAKRWAGISAMALLLCMSTLAVTAQDETTTETTVQTETTTSTRNRPSEGMSTGARAGIKGGLNASNFINDEITDKNGRFGFHAGV
jgi:hypothetical protein